MTVTLDPATGREHVGEADSRWRKAIARVRELDWLGLFLASWVAPLAFDATFGLTYFTSLLFWLVPTIMLLPRFLHYTDPGGRRRTAIRIAILQILALGIVLDFVLGRYVLQFDTVNPQHYVLWIRDVPIEEMLFYAMAPIAILMVYAWCDEFWVAEYNPVKSRLAAAAADTPLVMSTRALAIGIVLEALGLYLKHRWDPTGPAVPFYYTFLVVGVFVPLWFFFETVAPLVNWRAFGVTTFVRALHVAGVGGNAGAAARVVGLPAARDDRLLRGRVVVEDRAVPARGGDCLGVRAVLVHFHVRSDEEPAVSQASGQSGVRTASVGPDRMSGANHWLEAALPDHRRGLR